MVSFGLVLIQVPLLLHYWGAAIFGAWNALFSFYSLLITLDTGHQSYLGSIFMQTFHGKRENLRDELASGIRIAFVLGGIQLLLCLTIAGFGLARLLIGADVNTLSSVELVGSLTALVIQWIVAGSIGGILVKIFSAGGYYTRAAVWGIGYRIVFTVALCTGAALSERILPAAIAVGVSITLYTLLPVLDLRRIFPEIFPWWEGGSWKRGWRNLRLSAWLTVSGFIQQFSGNGLILVVTHLLNTVAVSILTTLRTLSNTATQATLIVVQPVLPDLIKYHVAGDGMKVQHTLAGLWFVSGLVINIGLAVALAVAPWFYGHWTRGLLPFDAGLFAFLVLGVQIRNIASPLLHYLLGLNDLEAQMKIAIGQTLATLMVCALLSGPLGVRAAGAGIVAGEVVGALLAYRAVAGTLKLIRVAMSAGMLLFPLWGLVLMAAGYTANLWLTDYACSIAGLLLAAVLLLAWWQWVGLPVGVRERILRLVPRCLIPNRNSVS